MEYTSESLSELIFQVINNILTKLFASLDKTIYSLLDNITFIDENILEQENFKKIVGENSSSGIILICNALLLGFFIFYGIQYLTSHLTYIKVQKPSQFIFKAIIFIALMNSSLWFCKEIIYIISLITKAINLLSQDLFNIDISFTEFIKHLNFILYEDNYKLDIFSFDGIVKSFSSIGMISLIFTYSLRYLLIQIFVILCPFAFLTLLSDNTKHFFKSWFRNFLSLLLIQILLSIVLLVSFSLIDISNLELQKLLYIASIYAITRCNYFMKELIGGISFDIKSNISSLR
jgi:hypothetical protein